MALKKGDRIQGKSKAGVEHGFVYKTGAKIVMVLDDGKRTLSGPPVLFTPSTAPLPADSPFAKVFTKTGERVTFDDDGKAVEGIVIKGDIFSAKVRAGLAEYTVPQGMLSKSKVQVPVDPPGPMDAWSVRKYKPVMALSEETVAFTAEILLDGKKVIDASNNGHGGCNMYYGPRDILDRLHADATAWAKSFGDEKAFEAADDWLGWAAEEKPLGLTATEHFADAKVRWAEFMGGNEEPDAPRM